MTSDFDNPNFALTLLISIFLYTAKKREEKTLCPTSKSDKRERAENGDHESTAAPWGAGGGGLEKNEQPLHPQPRSREKHSLVWLAERKNRPDLNRGGKSDARCQQRLFGAFDGPLRPWAGVGVLVELVCEPMSQLEQVGRQVAHVAGLEDVDYVAFLVEVQLDGTGAAGVLEGANGVLHRVEVPDAAEEFVSFVPGEDEVAVDGLDGHLVEPFRHGREATR
jgi:hypothetical protein